jgi:hypothetical protein
LPFAGLEVSCWHAGSPLSIQINGRRLVGTTLLKRYHVLFMVSHVFRHVLVLSGKTVQIDTPTHRRKKGLADPTPPLRYGSVV